MTVWFAEYVRGLWEAARAMDADPVSPGVLADVRAQLDAPLVPADAEVCARAIGALARTGARPEAAKTAAFSVALLAVIAKPRLVAHELRPAIPRLVAGTDLHGFVGRAPALFAAPWLAYVGRPARGERLWGADTIALGGYPWRGRDGSPGVALVGYLAGDTTRAHYWRPDWTARDLGEITRTLDDTPVIFCEDGAVSLAVDARRRADHLAWSHQAARFATIFGALLEAERTPVGVKPDPREDRRGLPGRPTHVPGPVDGWLVRRVHVRETPRTYAAPAAPPSGVPAGSGGEGRVAETVRVVGYLRRQHYGPRNELQRWQHIPEHAARRWVMPAAVRCIVEE